MKNMLVWMSTILVLLFLVACGDNDEVQNPPANDTGDVEEQGTSDENQAGQNDDTTKSQAGSNQNQAVESPYSFKQFDLDVDMENDVDIIEVEYEQEVNETEASYYDKNQDIQLNGDEAMQELDEIFSSFKFDENTPRDEVLNEVRSAFNIPDDAQHIELEITFNDGTEVEYNE